MSSKRHNSSRDLFYPTISLSRSPTFRQKKGMIIQRDISLPEPVTKVSTYLSEQQNALQAMKGNHIKTVRSIYIQDIPASASTLYPIDSTFFETICKELMISDPERTVYSFFVDQFTVRNPDGSGSFPSVNYTYYVGTNNATVTTASTTVQDVIYTGAFPSPSGYINSGYVTLYGPRLYRNSTYANDGDVTSASIYSQSSSSSGNYVYQWTESGRPFYWFFYSKGDIPLDFMKTALTIDNTSSTDTDKKLYIMYQIQYVK